MPNLNRVQLMGHLTRDPEMRYLTSGKAVCEFGLAINEEWKDKASGEKKEKTHFIDCVAWGRTGEVIHEYFTKGKPIFIEGKLDFQQWEDQSSGQKRSKLKVVVEQFQFLGSRDDSQSSGGGQSQGRQQTKQAGQQSFDGGYDGPEGDVPF